MTDDNPSGSKFGLHLLQSQDKREQTDISVQGGLPPTKGCLLACRLLSGADYSLVFAISNGSARWRLSLTPSEDQRLPCLRGCLQS